MISPILILTGHFLRRPPLLISLIATQVTGVNWYDEDESRGVDDDVIINKIIQGQGVDLVINTPSLVSN